MVKPCRHLASLSLGKLSDRLSSSSTLPSNFCNSCSKPTESPNFACLTCLQSFCLPSHLNQHARERNHPLSFNLAAAITGPETTDNIEQNFYCSICSNYPKINEPGKKERVNLEKIKNYFQENQKNLKTDSFDKTDTPETDTTAKNKIIPKGLVNLGNTCFMNSALQLLAVTLHRHGPLKTSSSSPIWNSLLHHLQEIYSTEAAVDSKKNKKSSHKNSSTSVNPKEFLSLLSGKQKKFASMQQQDAHDFLRLLFNSVSEAPQIELFGGKFVSRVVCDRCKKVSDTVEPFLDISLSLPDESEASLSTSLKKLSIDSQDDSDNRDDSQNDSDNTCDSIAELLKNWNKKILLQDENGYYCESCSPQDTQSLQNASLQFFLTDPLPPFLILHLQRFRTQISRKSRKSKNGGGGGMVMTIEKDDRPISFPLNLTISSNSSLCSKDTNYRLYGYIIHEGSSTSCGHYTAVVSANDSWFYISDTRVKEISMSRALDVDTYTPYLLFHQRVD